MTGRGNGSPPRTWGRWAHAGAAEPAHRFTPTHVGTIASAASVSATMAVHPHARGDDTAFLVHLQECLQHEWSPKYSLQLVRVWRSVAWYCARGRGCGQAYRLASRRRDAPACSAAAAPRKSLACALLRLIRGRDLNANGLVRPYCYCSACQTTSHARYSLSIMRTCRLSVLVTRYRYLPACTITHSFTTLK